MRIKICTQHTNFSNYSVKFLIYLINVHNPSYDWRQH